MDGTCPSCGVHVLDVNSSDTISVVGGVGEWRECRVCGETNSLYMWVEPIRPATERDAPVFIDDRCDECDTELVLYDEYHGQDVLWYDEWWCPTCDDAIRLDYPTWKRLIVQEEA